MQSTIQTLLDLGNALAKERAVLNRLITNSEKHAIQKNDISQKIDALTKQRSELNRDPLATQLRHELSIHQEADAYNTKLRAESLQRCFEWRHRILATEWR